MYDDISDDLFLRKTDLFNYQFVQIPIELIKNRMFMEVSASAKLLYGLILCRLSLSIKNDMCDEKGRYFIYYTIENVMKDLNIGSTKAKKLFRELSNIGESKIGLITKRKSFNGPSRIYILNFSKVMEQLPKGRNYDPQRDVSATIK